MTRIVGQTVGVAVVLMVIAAWAPAVLAASPDCESDRPVTVDRQGDGYLAEARFHVTAGVDTVWGVLTDYDHIDDYSSDVQESEILPPESGQSANQKKLRQVVRQPILGPWKAKMQFELTVEESYPNTIQFKDTLLKDVRSHEGSWSLSGDQNGTWVTYRLRTSPKVLAVSFVVKKLVLSAAQRSLDEVCREIMKRSAARADGHNDVSREDDQVAPQP